MVINPLSENLIEFEIKLTKIYIILSTSENIMGGTEFLTIMCNPIYFIYNIGLNISFTS